VSACNGVSSVLLEEDELLPKNGVKVDGLPMNVYRKAWFSLVRSDI